MQDPKNYEESIQLGLRERKATDSQERKATDSQERKATDSQQVKPDEGTTDKK